MSAVGRSVASVGAAVFALGLCLAGPGVVSASADTGDGGGATASATSSGEAAQPNRAERRSARADSVPRAALSSASRSAAPAASVDSALRSGQGSRTGSVKAAGAQRRAVAAQPRSVAAVVAAGTDRQRAVSLPTADIPTALVAVPVAAAAGDDVVDGATTFAGVSGVQDRLGVRGQAVTDPKVGVAGQAIADLKVGVAVALDRLGDWLSGLPANPISDFLSGALLVVRRTLLPDVPTIPRVMVTNTTVVEGGDVGSTTDAVFTVILERSYDELITVAYSTDKGTFQRVIDQITDAVTGVGPGYVAISGQDYVPVTGLLSFAPGQTSQQVSVAVLGDNIDEPTETFSLNIFPVVRTGQVAPGLTSARATGDAAVAAGELMASELIANSDFLLATGVGKIRCDCTIN